MKLVHCPYCGHRMPASNVYCSNCGRRISDSKKNGRLVPGLIIAGMCVVLGTGGVIHLVNAHNRNANITRQEKMSSDSDNSQSDSNNNSDSDSNSQSDSNNNSDNNSDSDWKHNTTDKLPSQPAPTGQYDPGPNPDGSDPSRGN